MLSVFITPCTKPTRIHSLTSLAVRRQISSNQVAYTDGDGVPAPENARVSRNPRDV